MKRLFYFVTFLSFVSFLKAGPVWELGRDAIPKEQTQGRVEPVDGALRFDGTNAFALPITLLGKQRDYTIEFEVSRDAEAKNNEDALELISWLDKERQAGLAVHYHPPGYEAARFLVNDGNIESRGFLPKADTFYKYSFVVKDGKLQVFRDGTLVLLTDTIQPGRAPIRFGTVKGDKALKPYTMRNIRIFDEAILPKGFDPNADRMRTYTGDQYTMQRAKIDDPTLPRILVVGDSISMGYRSFITEHFKDRAYVDYWVGGTWFSADAVKGENSEPKRGWNGVLANGPYDVISWNAMTLHMWSANHIGRCPEESLKPNMEEMTDYLRTKAPKTALIWVRCTPWRNVLPDGTQGVDNPANERIVRYNAIVDGVMKERKIPIVDLYAISLEQLGTIAKGSSDILHWNRDVSNLFAQAIIGEIEKALTKKRDE